MVTSPLRACVFFVSLCVFYTCEHPFFMLVVVLLLIPQVQNMLKSSEMICFLNACIRGNFDRSVSQ